MARIRSIKPDFFHSSITQCSIPARLTFQGLWCHADDFGRGVADPRIIKGAVWPLDDDVTHVEVAQHLDELEATRHILRYEVGGKSLLVILSWEDHQAAAFRRGDAKYPPPPAETPDPCNLHDQDIPLHADDVQKVHSTKERELTMDRETLHAPASKRPKKRQESPVPDEFPVTDALRKWASQNGVTVDLDWETEQFLDYHRAQGNRRVDWVSSWRTWMRNTLRYGPSRAPAGRPAAEPPPVANAIPMFKSKAERDAAYAEFGEPVELTR